MLRGFLPGLLVLAAAEPSAAPGAPRSQSERAESGADAAERGTKRVAAPRYALIPPRNLSGNDGATDALFGRLSRALEARGASFVGSDEIDQALRERRVRYTDSLATHDLAALAERTQATHTLLATVFDFVPGKEPRIAFTLRALDNTSGARVLSCAITLRGVDFEGLLGLGRIEDVDVLADEAIARALDVFDDAGAPREDLAGEPARSRPREPDGGYGFTREDFEPRAIERVALLPFANRSTDVDATPEFGEFLANAWFREAGVQVVEAADLRAALVARKVRNLQFVDLASLAAIGRSLGVRYFVIGAIERYGDEVLVDDRRFPEIEATVQLVDTERARIVAAAAVTRRGSDYQTLLGLGAVHDPVELALRSARELVLALGG